MPGERLILPTILLSLEAANCAQAYPLEGQSKRGWGLSQSDKFLKALNFLKILPGSRAPVIGSMP